MAAPTNPSYRLRILIHQLSHHRPESGQNSGEVATENEIAASASKGDGRDLDNRGKVFSSTSFLKSDSPSRVVRSPERFHPKRAAVLICLFEGEIGDLRVILTERSSNLSTHSGEVSLPGGQAEAGDADDCETATREAKEEIGLDPSLVTVVSILEPYLSVNLMRVVPVIGVLSDKKAFIPSPNAAEVETVFDAPLEIFLKDENHRSEEREWRGEKCLLHYFEYETNKKKFVIWGFTANILIHTASVVFQQEPSFPQMKSNFKYPKGFIVT